MKKDYLVTGKEIIEKVYEIYGEKYKYPTIIQDKLYRIREKVSILCPIHGYSEEYIWKLLEGSGCPICDQRRQEMEFIEKSIQLYNNKYDYSNVHSTYTTDPNNKVKIKCPIHGAFFMTPERHLKPLGEYTIKLGENNVTIKCGCPKCMEEKQKIKSDLEIIQKDKTLQTKRNNFIELAKQIHGDNKYCYSLTIPSNKTICVICPEHGEFWITAKEFLKGKGCPQCSNKEDKIKKEQFITTAKQIYGNKYDYSNVEYKGNDLDVRIKCPKHGNFYVTAKYHLYRGIECPDCRAEEREIKRQEEEKIFLQQAKEIYGNYFNYSSTVYETKTKPVLIKCPKHGYFEQKPSSHLKGEGCPNCIKKVVFE